MKKEIIPILLIILMFIAGAYFYDKVNLNEEGKMPIHWNAKGEVDSYGNRFIGLFLMPVVVVLIYLLFQLIPTMAVYKEHLEEFKGEIYGMKVVFILFFIAIYIATLLPSFGYNINMNYFIIPWISLLFIYLGYAIKDAKRNFFIGIRTPWTLASDRVWNKTHKIGSKLLMVTGVVFLLALVFPKYMIWIIIVPILLVILFLFIYSFVEYKKLKRP